MSVNLAELQRRKRQDILKQDVAGPAALKPANRGACASRAGEIASGPWLSDFIANDHPLLQRYMGDTQFNAATRSYVAKHPSDAPNARWFSRHFPKFLRTTLPYSRKPELAELASLERALNDAFDAPDLPHIAMSDLAAIDPARFSNAILDIHPSAKRLKAMTNVTSLWSSLKCEEPPPRPINLDAPQELLVWRQSLSSRFRMLGGEEAMAFDAAAKQMPFGVICEMIAMTDEAGTAGRRAAAYLRGWIEAQVISAVRLSAAPDEK